MKRLPFMLMRLCPCIAALALQQVLAAESFVNFETPPIHPVALSPDGSLLAVCNLPDGRVEFFDIAAAS